MGLVFGIGAILIVVVGVLALRGPLSRVRRPADRVLRILPDKNPRYVHLIAEHRFMPESGDSWESEQHYVLDLGQAAFYPGRRERGELSPRSEAFKLSLEHASSTLGVQLEVVNPKKEKIFVHRPNDAQPKGGNEPGVHVTEHQRFGEVAGNLFTVRRVPSAAANAPSNFEFSFEGFENPGAHLRTADLFVFSYTDLGPGLGNVRFGGGRARLVGLRWDDWSVAFDLPVK